MSELLATLTEAIEASAPLAVCAAFAWGICSVLLSPCHLSSVPLIVGFVEKQGCVPPRRAFVISALFALGILTTIAALGAITAAAGGMLGDVGALGNYALAMVFVAIGLHFFDVIPLPWSGLGQVTASRQGPMAGFVLGLLFGIAVGPCTFAFMAPMLGVTFKAAGADLAYGILLLLCYGIGHCAVIVLAGTSVGVLQRYLNWNQRSRGTAILRRVCGVLVMLGGIYLIYTAP